MNDRLGDLAVALDLPTQIRNDSEVNDLQDEIPGRVEQKRMCAVFIKAIQLDSDEIQQHNKTKTCQIHRTHSRTLPNRIVMDT